MTHLFDEAIAKLTRLADRGSLSAGRQHALKEAVVRLQSVRDLAASVIQRNQELLKADPRLNEHRSQITPDAILRMLREHAQTDANLAANLAKLGDELKIGLLAESSAYNLSEIDAADPTGARLLQLHADTEEIYQNLWKVKERLNRIPQFRKFDPVGVRNVRNWLIEHPEHSRSGATIFSFGVATRGPVLRPIKPSGVNAPADAGLEPNVEEFVKAIIDRVPD